MSGPLAGVRVLDLTTVLMGPYACQMLAEHGADVVKVEDLVGEVGRQIGPRRSPGMGALYLGLNRGKRSIAIDLKRSEGIALLHDLIGRNDVIVTNLRPAALARLGLSYDEVRSINPRIIYCTLFGFGEDGPYAGRPAFDDLIQGSVGIPSLIADATGGEPRYVPVNMADRTVGLHAAACISMALFHQQKTGQGQKLEVPMFETMANFVLSDHLYGRAFEPPIGDAGYVRLMSPDRRPYRTADGYICAVLYTDEHWRRFLTFVDRPELIEDPRFRSMSARTTNIDAVLAVLRETLLQRTTAEWLDIFDRLDVPRARLATLDSLLDDEHLKAVGFFRTIEHPSEGTIRVTTSPEKWSGTPSGHERECALLGQHTIEVLEELGYDRNRVAGLLDTGVVLAQAAATRTAERAS